jgi:hypothetical protein
MSKDSPLRLLSRGAICSDASVSTVAGAMTKVPLGGKKVGRNPPDRGNIGTKHSVVTDGGGAPIGLVVEGANRHDFTIAKATIESIPLERPEPAPEKPQGMCLDKGYDCDEGRDLLAECGGYRPHPRAWRRGPCHHTGGGVTTRDGGWSSAHLGG